MKITPLSTFLLAPRRMFLKAETDAGVAGRDEPVIEGRALTAMSRRSLARLLRWVRDAVVGQGLDSMSPGPAGLLLLLASNPYPTAAGDEASDRNRSIAAGETPSGV